jgi:hypothetical protein
LGGEKPKEETIMNLKEPDLQDVNEKQFSLIFDISEKTARKLAKNGDLPCEYINRRLVFNIPKIISHFRKLEGGAA